ncbi:unnamed protein product, partial [Coffea canephora]
YCNALSVLFEDKKGVRKVILNRPKQLNCLTYEMFCQMLKKLGDYEEDPNTRLVILKGNGRAFCAGGDVKSVFCTKEIQCSLVGCKKLITA